MSRITECVDRMTSEVGVQLLSVEEPDGGRNKGEGAPPKKGPWTKEEDEILKDYVAKYGERNWSSVHRRTELARCGKSCRLRWANHLKPNIKKGAFTPEEEELIIELHAKIGNKWSRIAAELPGRTDNDIKNFWNTRLRRQRRAEKYLNPPNASFDELSEDKQNKMLVTASSANSDPALLPIIKNIEIPTVEFKNFEPSLQLRPPGLFNIGSSSFLDITATRLLDQNLNSSLDTRSVRSTVHPPKRIWGSWFSDRIADISHLSFSGNTPVSHASLYGNSSSESSWEHRLELPSRQTSLASWSSPSSIPSLESSYTLIQTPPNEYTDLFSLSPRHSGLLNDILYDSQTPKASWNNSHQDTSCSVVPDSCPVLREILWGTNADTISPSGHSSTSMFNEYTPSTGGALVEHQSIEPLIGFDVNQKMASIAPTGRMDVPLNHPSFCRTDWCFAPTVWPHNGMD